MDAAEGEAAFRPSEVRAPSRKNAGRSGKRWRKRSCALIEPRSPQSPRRAPPCPALLCFRGFLPRSSAVGGGYVPRAGRHGRFYQCVIWPWRAEQAKPAGFADGNAPCVCAPSALLSPCFARFARQSVPRVRAFRLDASCRRPFRRRTRLCAVRRLKLKVQILYITKRKQNCNRFFFF